MTKTVMLVAGEASGDMYGAELANRLQRRGNIHCIGMGSRHMRTAGVELLADCSNIAVVGLFEVLTHWNEIQAALRILRTALIERRPQLLVLIDYPEFNLKLAETAKALGIRVLFYISPQVWAWRPHRVHKIGRRIDHMAVIFPFETEVYRKAGIPVSYVGHPLAQRVKPSAERAQLITELGLHPAKKIVALMPGSRRGEIKRLLPVLIEATRLIRQQLPTVQFILPVASSLQIDTLQALVDHHGIVIQLVQGRTYDVVHASDIAITASGTATLEIALLETPMIVIYKISPLSYAILKRLITVKHIALANIVAGERVVPELIQADATPVRIAAEAVRQLTDAGYHRRIKDRLQQVRQNLGQQDGIEGITNLALQLLE
jgi:lipid-A-disaccharide synthase